MEITGGRRRAALFQPGMYEKCLTVAEYLARIGEKYGKNAAQICINWLVKNEGITAPIVGGANPAHALENIAALDFELSAEDYDSIDEVSRNFCSQMPEYLLFFDTRTKEDFKEENLEKCGIDQKFENYDLHKCIEQIEGMILAASNS